MSAGFLVNLGSCGSDAPGWGIVAGIMEWFSAVASAACGDVVAAFVRQTAADEAGVHSVACLELAVTDPARVEPGVVRVVGGRSLTVPNSGLARSWFLRCSWEGETSNGWPKP